MNVPVLVQLPPTDSWYPARSSVPLPDIVVVAALWFADSVTVCESMVTGLNGPGQLVPSVVPDVPQVVLDAHGPLAASLKMVAAMLPPSLIVQPKPPLLVAVVRSNLAVVGVPG